jgi:hypothetical protein
MNLEDVYTSRVQGQNNARLNISLFSPSGAPTFQRDPEIMRLESNIFSQLSELCSEPINSFEPTQASKPSPQISFVSFEDALKELNDMKISSSI